MQSMYIIGIKKLKHMQDNQFNKYPDKLTKKYDVNKEISFKEKIRIKNNELSCTDLKCQQWN